MLPAIPDGVGTTRAAVASIPGAILELPVRTAMVRLVPSHPAGEVAPYPASAIRGAIGRWTLARMCPAPGIPCEGCDGREDCPHGQLFFPTAGPDGPRTPPPPWSLWATWDRDDRDLAVGVQTCGRHAETLMPVLLDALRNVAEDGAVDGVPKARMVPGRAPDRAQPVRDLVRPGLPAALRIRTVTPVSLKVDGRELTTVPTLDLWVKAARRRAMMLARSYVSGSGADADQEATNAQPTPVEPLAPARRSVRSVVIRRWSERQGRTIWLRGIEGSMVYEPVTAHAAEWLAVGGVLGIGGDPTHGFGRVEISPR